MDKDVIINAVKSLTEDGAFYIDKLEYSEKDFGNIILILKGDKINIRFVKSKGECFCEVWKSKEYYLLEDVLEVVGVKDIINSKDFSTFIKEASEIIKKNLNQILGVFDSKNWKITHDKLKETGTRRVLKRLGIKI